MYYGHAAEAAIRAAFYLAARPPGELSRVQDIAAATKLPKAYLSKVIQRLAQAGLVRTFRGPGGGIELGIGAGWCKEEFEAIGAPPFEDRGNVTDEWMMACKELWSNEDPKFDGKYVQFSDVVFTPKPVQKAIPIWVGGESGPALRRTARLGDAWYPIGSNKRHLLDSLPRYRAGIARSPLSHGARSA